jgi:hypothetical protein
MLSARWSYQSRYSRDHNRRSRLVRLRNLPGSEAACPRGSYYSRYSITSESEGPEAIYGPHQTDTSLPANHVYDKVITGRINLNRFWNVKVEGHFMSGYGESTYPDGFYPQVNPQGFKPNTNALVIKTGIYF